MSEGFHPKPKLSFPSALALGIEGLDEVMELELVESEDPRALSQRLQALAPCGLAISQVEVVGPGAGKARVKAMYYQFPVPNERRPQVAAALEQLQAVPSLLVQRVDRAQPIDLKADLVSVALGDGAVCFCLRATDQASARPRDLLQALGLADLEQQGHYLTRTSVQLAVES